MIVEGVGFHYKKSASAQIRWGKEISIARAIRLFDSRLRNRETIWLRRQMHLYSSEMVLHCLNCDSCDFWIATIRDGGVSEEGVV